MNEGLDFKTNLNEPLDIVVNGFSMKKTLFNVLKNYLPEENAQNICKEIIKQFSIKLRLKQGKDE